MPAPSGRVATTFCAPRRPWREAGAAFLDVGAMSTAPYLTGRISEHEEADRLGSAVRSPGGQDRGAHLRRYEPQAPARAALEAGARDHQ